jgi:coenzyme F420-reducing hydrogenase delta subunit
VETAVEAACARGERPLLALVCAETAGGDWNHFNAAQWRALLPDYHVWPVPCVGWVQPKLLERMLAKGAAGLLAISCGEGELRCREGGKFLQQRIDGTRQPALRTARANPDNFLHLTHDPAAPDRTCVRAAEFARTLHRPAPPPRSRWRAAAAGLALCAGFIGVIALVADAPFRNPAPAAPELVCSLKAWGDWIDAAAADARDQAAKPVHMRSTTAGKRTRASVTVRLTVDGSTTEHTLSPLGLAHDGASVGVLRRVLPAGPHEVQVAVFTAPGATEPRFAWSSRLDFVPRRATVVSFDPATGFLVEK